jgi:hypothetical protein
MATRRSRQGSNPERNIAIHEAGHAVAAFFQHQRIVRATIIPTTEWLGHVLHSPLKFADRGMFDESLRGIDRAEKRIVVLFAGPIAARKFEQRSHWRMVGRSDFDSAAKMFSYLESDDDEYNRLYGKLLWRRAELLVQLRWPEINAVADELVRHRTLDLDGVRAAIERA